MNDQIDRILDKWGEGYYEMAIPSADAELRELVRIAIEDEREECARFCEDHEMSIPYRNTTPDAAGYVTTPSEHRIGGYRHQGLGYAVAIRKRKEASHGEEA